MAYQIPVAFVRCKATEEQARLAEEARRAEEAARRVQLNSGCFTGNRETICFASEPKSTVEHAQDVRLQAARKTH